MTENPFDALEIDPKLSGKELTRRIRKIIERAPDGERAKIQAHWQRLTMHDDERVRFALLAHPRPQTADSRGIATLAEAIPPATSPLSREPVVLTRVDVIARERRVVRLDPFRPVFDET
ncbi:MAG: hypothetical protein R3E66_10415 [bacterium]